MPSPLGHALAGVAAAWLIQPPPTSPGRSAARLLRHALIFGAIAAAPDLDLLWGNHSGPTHGLGAALLAGLAAWVLVRTYRWGSVPAWRAGLVAAAAYGSHTLLDWMGRDTSAPIGIMALWPVSREYFESDLHVFMAISRRYWQDGFLPQNLAAVTREVLILAPILAVVMVVRGWTSTGGRGLDSNYRRSGRSGEMTLTPGEQENYFRDKARTEPDRERGVKKQ